MEKQGFKSTIVLYTYRYMWQTVDGKLCVKFVTEPQEGHARFQEAIKNDSSITSCMREYCHEVNFEYLGFTEPVKKQEQKEKKEDEEKSS